jgi:hypothetical protein
MTVTENEYKQLNLFANEPPIIMSDHQFGEPHNVVAERWNGRFAMVGFVAGVISYALTGNLFFGVL